MISMGSLGPCVIQKSPLPALDVPAKVSSISLTDKGCRIFEWGRILSALQVKVWHPCLGTPWALQRQGCLLCQDAFPLVPDRPVLPHPRLLIPLLPCLGGIPASSELLQVLLPSHALPECPEATCMPRISFPAQPTHRGLGRLQDSHLSTHGVHLTSPKQGDKSSPALLEGRSKTQPQSQILGLLKTELTADFHPGRLCSNFPNHPKGRGIGVGWDKGCQGKKEKLSTLHLGS